MLPNSSERQYQHQSKVLKALALCGLIMGIGAGLLAIIELYHYSGRTYFPYRQVIGMSSILLNSGLVLFLAYRALQAGKAIRYQGRSDFLQIWWQHQHQLWKAMLWQIAGLAFFFLLVILL